MEHTQTPQPVSPQHSQELRSLTDTAKKLCHILARIVEDPEQFYLPEKPPRGAAPDAGEPAPKRLDTKTLKDVIEIMKTLTLLIRDLQELPDQPERLNQHIALAKLNLAQEQAAPGESGEIALAQEVVPFAQ